MVPPENLGTNHLVPPLPAAPPYGQKESKWNWTDIAHFDMVWPAEPTPFVPTHPQPNSETRFDQGIVFTSAGQLNGGEWPVWANGPFTVDVSHEYFEYNKKLQVLWATQSSSYSGGKGSVNSTTAQGGKISSRKCLGVLRCSSESCPVVLRPVTGGQAKVNVQLENGCQCGAELEHIKCDSHSWTIQWGQIGDDITTRIYRYVNGAVHNHSRFPNPARTTITEDKHFWEAYEARPKATPTQMMVGAPTVDGFSASAPELGLKFANPAYTGYCLRQEKQKSRIGLTSAFGHFARLREWKQKNPTVLCEDYTGSNMTCISV